MFTYIRFLFASIAVASLVSPIVPAYSAELKVISAVGVQSIIEDLGPKFERATGHKLAITFDPIGRVVTRIQDGETADVIIIPSQGIEGFVKEGKAAMGNVAAIARAGMGVAVRKSTPKPDISSPEAFKRAMLAAKSINVSDPARGGVATAYIMKVFERLGIGEEMKPKMVFAKVPGAAGAALEVANGEAEIALNQLQEFVPVAGIEIVGPFPGDLQLTTVFSAVIMGSATNVDVARALINFLRTPEAAKVIKTKGLEPAP
jgi:molybdate transport system substrate-binding protein